jgi:RNA polymerase sigma-70 factor (ECF subfamily)
VTGAQDRLAGAFEQARPRLVRVAYAILGSHSDAEDVVADCWLRLAAQDAAEPVRDVEAWAVVAVSRMAVDVLRSARVRREQYVGPWLPEPVVTDAAGGDPADRVTLADEVSYALLVVLETLTPAERTAFVLHDLFGMPFGEVAAVTGRTPAAVRQLASRARRHVRERGQRPPADPAEHRRVVDAFAAAARRPVLGPDRVARFLLGVLAKAQPAGRMAEVLVNGYPGFALWHAGRLVTVVAVTVTAGRVSRVDMIRSPAKLPGRPPCTGPDRGPVTAAAPGEPGG